MRNLIFLFPIILLGSCNHASHLKTETHSSVPEPEYLPEYFQSLLADSANYCVGGDSLDLEQIFRSFRLLQDYADGKTDKYPAWSVKQALGHIADIIVRAESEGYCFDIESDPNSDDDCTACCLSRFLEAYMEQAFRLCPDIKLLLSLVSEDEEMGIFNFEHFEIPYMVGIYDVSATYIIYKDANKIYRKALWAKGESYRNIYQIDHNGKRYYLLVNYKRYLGALFSLISIDEDGIKECLQPVPDNISCLMSDIYYSEYDDEKYPEIEKLIFNPKELTWNECRKNKNGNWVEFPGSKTFKLVFGDKIYLEMAE